ncbi:multiple sugar transport system permease protein [Microbacterium trichothecenolyticum]|uniref:carbohydrate ABC transporter permease n=1 Tax=Microbacterium trichothecenolyticum TaxID=69370 RepID=UPI002857651E|nr:carbohydrate ABC transporter permease [Microbacterium trichothecenolyticum]MDR7184587.1 multiple sugar transport system permease protein [Microbacterium trichothecenolyticum]
MAITERIVTGRPRSVPRDGVSAKRQRVARRALRYFALVLGALAFLFPFYYMLVVSFSPDWVADWSVLVPRELTLNNYAELFESTDVGRSLLNSAIFAGGVVLLTQIGALLCGYALAFISFHGSRIVFATVLLLQIVPFQVLLIPLYVLVTRTYGLGDTYAGMILPFAINAGVVFIYRQFFLTIPVQMIEAAKLDGAGHLRTLWHVILPLTRPALVTGIVLAFVGPWNDFLWPFLITKQQEMQPLAVSLISFQSNIIQRLDNPTGAIMADATILMLPSVILFILGQRWFTTAGLGGAVKE